MKALFYSDWHRLEISDQPTPVPKSGEVLMKVSACGLCGSELETYKNKSTRRSPPLILGHEFCGEIVDTGKDVMKNLKGQKKIVFPLVFCNQCPACRRNNFHLCENRRLFGMHRMGAFAEYVAVPERCLIEWPEGIPAQEACLTEPLANGVHVVNLTKHIKPRKVLVIGAGPIGLMCQQAFQSMLNAEVIVADVSKYRLETAVKLGAQKGINVTSENTVEFAKKFSNGEGVDLVVDAVGSRVTKKQSLESIRNGGATVWIGLHENKLDLDSYDITLPEKQILGTYSGNLSDFETAIKLIKKERVDVSGWVDCFNLDEGVEAFHKMLAPGDNDIKAVFIP
jgi:threonine dehydrogenase-like Zn-dependent dehydrogenase